MRMLNYRYVALIAGLAAASSPALHAQARATGGVGLSVWKDIEFRGENASFQNDVADLSRYGFRNAISSLRAGPGESWEACEQVNYGGRCQVFSGSESNLRQVNWNDRIASIRRVKGNGAGEGSSAGDLVLSSDIGFRGEQRRFSQAVSDLRREGFDRRAMSLQVTRGRWEVCRDTNFQNCRTVEGTVPDLSKMGFDRAISSIRPARGGEGNRPTYDEARRACETELGRHGWRVAGGGTPRRDGDNIIVEAQVRGTLRSQEATSQCTYDSRSGTVQIRF